MTAGSIRVTAATMTPLASADPPPLNSIGSCQWPRLVRSGSLVIFPERTGRTLFRQSWLAWRG
jgi:hypothetical protein